MFRPMLRHAQQLSFEECEQILIEAKRGVLSVQGDGGYPYGIPMNHLYLDGKLYFHCGREGHKLDALRRSVKASFCVIDEGRTEPGDWALRFQSVVVFGQVREVEDEKEIERLCRILSGKFTDDQAYVDREIRESLRHTRCLELSVDHMTGKRVREA